MYQYGASLFVILDYPINLITMKSLNACNRPLLYVLDRLLILCSAFSCASTLHAQKSDYIIQQIYVQQMQDAESSMDYESFYSLLNDVLTHPIDLNTAKRADYQQLPFLTDLEIQNLLAYRRIYGPFISTHQIQLVAHLRPQTIIWLPYFCCVSSPSIPLKSQPYYQQHLLMAYQPKAHQEDYVRLRYQIRKGKSFKAGVHLENDIGEQPFEHRGNDELKFYMKYAPSDTLSLYVGDFSVGFAQGLLINQGFLLGKMGAFNSYRAHSFRVSSGSTPIYTQGLACHLHYSHLDYKLFVGYKQVDASIDGNYYRTFYDTGIHHTTQLKHQNTVNEWNAGGQIQYQGHHFKMALNVHCLSFNKKAIPLLHEQLEFPYMNAGLSYSGTYHYQSLTLIGENAVTLEGDYALQNTIQLVPLSWLNCFIQQRYYSPHYRMRYAVAINEMGKVQNEAGVLLGTQLELGSKCTLRQYIDSYRNLIPVAKEAVTVQGYDYRCELNYHPYAHCKMRLLSKYETRCDQTVSTYLRWQLYYQYSTLMWQLFAHLNLSDTQHEGGLFHGLKHWDKGEVVGSEIQWHPLDKHFSFNYRYELFDIPDYANRVYLYEHNVSYYMYNPMLYGRGMRTYFFLQYRYHNWRFQSKYSLTHTQNNTRQDLRLNLEYKF